ncbi:unnamed protein product [Closterium sp. NIES-54]
MVTTTITRGQRVAICMCTWTGRNLATFTRQPGSSLYTLTTEPPQVAASGQVSASGQLAAPCSCRLLSHQTLLWHHRLGHPSLPRLRGMHSRLLPRSLPPLPPSPAPPYLPCVEVRQHAAPHSSSFPPTTAPLQTLHMDSVSKSASASLHQNGVAEHRIGLVMEVARTSMIHAAAPHFLWSFAVRYAAHQLNLWPRVSLPETSPTLRWTGKVGDASAFRVWGSRAFVRDASADKLSTRAIPCGPAPSGVSQVDPLPLAEPVEVTVDSGGAARGVASGGAEPAGAEPGGAEPASAEPRGAEPEGAEPGGAMTEGAEPGGAEPGGAEFEGAESGGADPRGTGSAGGPAGASPRQSRRREPLSLRQLHEWFARRTRLRSGAVGAGGPAAGGTGAGGAGVTSPGGVGFTAGAGGPGGAGAAGPGGARTRGTRATGAGGVGGAGARDPGAGGAGAGGAGAGSTGAGDPGAGGAGARGTGGAAVAGPGGARTRGTGAAGAGGVDMFRNLNNGYDCTAIPEAVRHLPTEEDKQIISLHPETTEITLNDPSHVTLFGFLRLSCMRSLKSISVIGNLEKPALLHLYSMTWLEELRLESVSEPLLPEIANLKALRHLELRETPMSGNGLAHLTTLSSLQSLVLSQQLSSRSGGAGSGGAETWGADPRGAATGGTEPGGAEPGVTEPGGAQPGGAGSARVASRGASSTREVLPPQELREWFARRWGRAAVAGGTTATTGSGGTCPGGAGAAGPGGTAEAAGVGPTGGSAGASGGTGAASSTGPGAAGATGVGAARGVGAGGSADAGTSEGAGAGATGAGGAAGAGAPAGSPGAVPAGSGGAPRPRPYFVPLLEQPVSPLPTPSPYSGPTGGLTERRAPASRPTSPARPTCTSRRTSSPRPPAVPGTHQMALHPSTAPLRVPLPSPPPSSFPAVPDPESDSLRAASPTVARFLATVVTDPSLASTAASALVAELVDFAARSRLDYAASLVAESASVCPPSVGGECALSTDVLEDRQEEFQCFAAALPHLVSTLLAPEGDPDAPDIPTPRSYAEAIEGPYSSQWQAAMDAEMASWKSTRTYVDEVPPPGANITFSPTPKMTTLRVLLHVAAQRDYKLHSLDFSTAFLQGSLHEEIWLRRPPGFTGSFPPGTQWSLRRPVYGLRQAPREWHDTLRIPLAALGFAPSTADPSLFLRTDTSLPPFYVLVYVDDLVFATVDTAGLAHVKSELQKRHTCTDLGELRSYLGLQITRDRAQRTITLTQSHMVQQVLQHFDFTYSSPQATPLSTRHSLSALPSDESVEPSGRILARYVAPGRHRPEHMAAAKRVLRYLCSTSGMGLMLGGRRPVVLTGHADASWADDQATQLSSQGYTFSLGSGSVSWRSTCSSSVLSSSCEAEIYAGAMAAQELRWLTYLLTDLGEQPRSPPVLYVDNKAMLALCREHRLEHRTKHIALRYFLARELQQRGQLRLAYVAFEANTADIFTKALAPGDHQRFCTLLGLVPTWPHLLTS